MNGLTSASTDGTFCDAPRGDRPTLKSFRALLKGFNLLGQNMTEVLEPILFYVYWKQ